MKVNGQIATRPVALPPLVFPRGEGELVFIALAVENFDEFNKLCPEPDPKQFGRLGPQGWEVDDDSPQYRDLMKQHGRQKWAYMFIKTLEPSNIEWETVNVNQPQTWKNFEKELRSVLGHVEYGTLVNLVEEANMMGSDHIEVARKRFLLKQEALRLQKTSPSSEPASTPSGEHASV